MKTSDTHHYYVYITTNKNKTVLYTAVTNDLYKRLAEHFENVKSFRHISFAGKYNAYFLLLYEQYDWIQNAIAREKEIKGWRREKKEALINSINPDWRFLNDEV